MSYEDLRLGIEETKVRRAVVGAVAQERRERATAERRRNMLCANGKMEVDA